jgi:outer membrane protein
MSSTSSRPWIAITIATAPLPALLAITLATGGCQGAPLRVHFEPTAPRRPALAAESPTSQSGVRPTSAPSALRSSLPTIPSDPTQPLALSVEQAVLLALRNNAELSMRALSPVVSGTFERLEQGTFDPELFANVELGAERSQQTARSTQERFSVTGQRSTAALGVRQRLSTGTTVEASLGHDFDQSSRTPEQQRARLGLSITQSLLRGLSPKVNLARIERAKLDTAASLQQLRAYVAAKLAETELSYWRFVLARRRIAIFEASLRIAEAQKREIAARIAVGATRDAEAAVAKAELARRKQALIDAQAALRRERVQLLQLINPAKGRLDLQLKATSDPRLAASPLRDTAARVALARRMRPELAEAKLRLKQQRLDVVVTKNGLLPRLDLLVTVGKSGFAQSFGGSFSDLVSKNYDASVGLSFSAPLPGRNPRATHLAAKTSRRQAKLAVENLRQQIALQVRLAIVEVERARRQIAASRVTASLQKQVLQAEKARFAVGKSTALAVAIAQRDLLSSEIASVEAVIAYRQALVRLYLAEGSLLPRRGIKIGTNRKR